MADITLPTRAVFSRSDEFWFDDGSIILESQPVPRVQFRVHRSLLATRSVVFGDMFTVASGTSTDTSLVDGIPVVVLSESEEELTILLRALYGPMFLHSREPLPLSAVATLLQLGRKYLFEDLREQAIALLVQDFPCTLEEFDRKPRQFTRLVEYPGILLDVIRLAREADVPQILPCAFYLATHSPDMQTRFIFEGVQTNSRDLLVSVAPLAAEDQKWCVLGKEQLTSAAARLTFEWVNHAYVPNCERELVRSPCLQFRTQQAYKLLRDSSALNALSPWNDNWEMCRICLKFSRNGHREKRAEVWKLLPSFFGLPEWDSLLKCANEDDGC